MQIELNEKEAEIVRHHLDIAANNLDRELKQAMYIPGSFKELIIEHVQVLEKVVNKLPD